MPSRLCFCLHNAPGVWSGREASRVLKSAICMRQTAPAPTAGESGLLFVLMRDAQAVAVVVVSGENLQERVLCAEMTTVGSEPPGAVATRTCRRWPASVHGCAAPPVTSFPGAFPGLPCLDCSGTMPGLPAALEGPVQGRLLSCGEKGRSLLGMRSGADRSCRPVCHGGGGAHRVVRTQERMSESWIRI